MANRPSYPDAVAHAVKAAIESAGTTVTAVAAATGLPQQTLSRRLNGASDTTTLRELDRIARHLGVCIETLTAPEHAA